MWCKKAVVLLFAALLLAAVPGCGIFSQNDPYAGDDNGHEMEKPDGDNGGTEEPGPGDIEDPDWEVTFTSWDLLTGNEIRFPNDYIGQVIYLNFYFYG